MYPLAPKIMENYLPDLFHLYDSNMADRAPLLNVFMNIAKTNASALLPYAAQLLQDLHSERMQSILPIAQEVAFVNVQV